MKYLQYRQLTEQDFKLLNKEEKSWSDKYAFGTPVFMLNYTVCGDSSPKVKLKSLVVQESVVMIGKEKVHHIGLSRKFEDFSAIKKEIVDKIYRSHLENNYILEYYE